MYFKIGGGGGALHCLTLSARFTMRRALPDSWHVSMVFDEALDKEQSHAK